MSKTIKRAVSLFSNCGAGDLGYARAGFRFDVMAELDPRRLEVCLLNHPTATGVPGDLRTTWPKVIAEYRRKAGDTRPTLVAACPPCQGMSTARSGRGHEDDADAGSRDQRNLLVTVVSKVVAALQPRLVVIENVQAFLTRKVRHPHTGLVGTAARFIIEDLHANYVAFPIVTDLCHFGVPQTRKRAFLTFIHKDVPVLEELLKRRVTPYPIPKFSKEFGGEPITLKRALKSFNLPGLDAKAPSSATSRVGGGLHAVPVWRDRRYPMVAAIPPHTGKGAWDNDMCERCGKVGVRVELDSAECPLCESPLLRPVVRRDGGGYRLVSGFRASSYSRMKSDEPAATITTASGHIGSDHTIHPFENRVLSPLECALLQTLPRGFNWGSALEKWGHTNIRNMIGEAVPPLFTRLHGRVLMSLLNGKTPPALLFADDLRCRTARRSLSLTWEPST